MPRPPRPVITTVALFFVALAAVLLLSIYPA